MTARSRSFLSAVAVILALLTAAWPSPARAQQVVADLSRHLVAITTGFIGTEVLLFGAIEGEGDVIVVVRGPDRQEVVRRKDRIGGIWVNADTMAFVSVPAFYAVAASRPVSDTVSERLLTRHRIGIDFLDLRPARPVDARTLADFRAGFVRNKVRQGLYLDKPASVTFLGNRLFRTNLYFPANVPTGTYTVEVLQVHQGRIVSAQTTPLLISKIGIGAEVYRFAHRHSVFYGLIAILIALAAGWAAGAVFRKA